MLRTATLKQFFAHDSSGAKYQIRRVLTFAPVPTDHAGLVERPIGPPAHLTDDGLRVERLGRGYYQLRDLDGTTLSLFSDDSDAD